MTTTRPLQGIRVINFGWVWAGPVAGQTLAFMGAEVLKIESRARIDMTRRLPPFAENHPDPDRSLPNHACWAGNGSVSLNLKKPAARELALALIARADIVIENFGPGVLEGLGLGYGDMRAAREDIILFSMPATGLRGPLSATRTYGLSLTSLTGLDSLTGYKRGGPLPFENAFADPFAGVLGAFGILSALRQRRVCGRGQHVDFSQQEAVMPMIGPAYMDVVMNGRDSAPLGNEHPIRQAAPHGVFPCRGEDAWLSLAVASDAEWQRLTSVMDSPAWSQSPDFARLSGRLEHIDALHRHIGQWTAAQERDGLCERLQRAGLSAAPVFSADDLLHSAHFRARQTFVEVEHPLGFREMIYGSYVKNSGYQATVSPGPVLGQDNDYAFRELLGLPEARYRALIEEQVIY